MANLNLNDGKFTAKTVEAETGNFDNINSAMSNVNSWNYIGEVAGLGNTLNFSQSTAKEFLVEAHIMGVETNDFVYITPVPIQSLSSSYITLALGMFFNQENYAGIYLQMTKNTLTINNYAINNNYSGNIKVKLYYR